MKCFLALEIPEVIHASLDLTLAAVIHKCPPARWIPAENRHLTLVFLGSVEEAMLGALHEVLARVCAAGRPMRLGFNGGGVFPDGKPARVVWVGLRPSSALSRLHKEAAEACAELGVPVERRPYLPHLTLARCRPAWPTAAGAVWTQACASRLSSAVGVASFGVDRASLFESVSHPEGVRYRVVRSYPLGRGSREAGQRDDSKR